jgi:hypothetical protein
MLMLFCVWFSLDLGRTVWWIWDFLSWTGLTGKLHWPDRCRDLLWKFSVQCHGARVACSTTFSSRCRWLLVPRVSSTPVAVWYWPTLVVESETCFGSRVHLVGVPISFEKNSYQLPFTPPLWSA